MPKISVIMPVYNTEKYVWEAIESILIQSFKDFEFIIVDDCSIDKSYEICKEYADRDDRIKLFRNEKNLWVVKTRNRLFENISQETKYIAILDADDVSIIYRLEKEFQFLESNLDYSVVGSNLIIIDEEWEVIWTRIYPKNNTEVWKIISRKSPLAQPSVMIRKSSLAKVGTYNEEFERCQDYELWFRFYDEWFKLWNIQDALLRYRVFSEQGKSKYLKLSIRNTIKIQEKYIYTKKYFNVFNIIHLYLEKLLLILPNSLILWLFKILEYRK